MRFRPGDIHGCWWSSGLLIVEPCRGRLCRGRLCTCPCRCFLNDQEDVRSIRAPPRPAAQLQAPQSLVAGWITHYSSQDERFRGNLNSTAPTPFSVIEFISIPAKFSQKEDGLTSPLDNPTDISVFSSDEHAPVKTIWERPWWYGSKRREWLTPRFAHLQVREIETKR